MLYELKIDAPHASPRMPLKAADKLKVSEKHIEEFLSGHLNEVIPQDQLMLIGQERKGKEEADLFALDKNGVLYIFELKRWESNKENLLQVMRYGQIFGRFDYERLEDLAKRHNKLEGDLDKAHQSYFDLEKPMAHEQFNHDQVFVVVTNGMDHDTLEAITYWSKKGLKVHSITFRLYEIDKKPFIFFDVYNPEQEVIIEANPGLYIVNTNATFMPEAWREMLSTPKAAAYYDAKLAIANIPVNSTVYLYHTKVGIIAKGKTTAGHSFKDIGADKNEECYVPLKFEWKLDDKEDWDEAISASEINTELKSGYRFRQPVFNITDEMATAIEYIRKERGLNK